MPIIYTKFEFARNIKLGTHQTSWSIIWVSLTTSLSASSLQSIHSELSCRQDRLGSFTDNNPISLEIVLKSDTLSTGSTGIGG